VHRAQSAQNKPQSLLRRRADKSQTARGQCPPGPLSSRVRCGPSLAMAKLERKSNSNRRRARAGAWFCGRGRARCCGAGAAGDRAFARASAVGLGAGARRRERLLVTVRERGYLRQDRRSRAFAFIPVRDLHAVLRTQAARQFGGEPEVTKCICIVGPSIMKIELDRFLPFRHRGSRADLALDPVQFDDIEQTWERIPHLFRASVASLPARWEEIFGPLRAGKIDDLMVAGQIGQSLDGRVATATGRSHYINCPAALDIFTACEHWLMLLLSASRLHAGTIRS
jgi:hypothetical protein